MTDINIKINTVALPDDDTGVFSFSNVQKGDFIAIIVSCLRYSGLPPSFSIPGWSEVANYTPEVAFDPIDPPEPYSDKYLNRFGTTAGLIGPAVFVRSVTASQSYAEMTVPFSKENVPGTSEIGDFRSRAVGLHVSGHGKRAYDTGESLYVGNAPSTYVHPSPLYTGYDLAIPFYVASYASAGGPVPTWPYVDYTLWNSTTVYRAIQTTSFGNHLDFFLQRLTSKPDQSAYINSNLATNPSGVFIVDATEPTLPIANFIQPGYWLVGTNPETWENYYTYYPFPHNWYSNVFYFSFKKRQNWSIGSIKRFG